MPTVLQFRRGTTAQNNAFTGSAGEITVDTTANTLRMHDGSTQGGSAMATVTGTETLTNKTLTTPVISTISNSGTLTLPTTTDTLVGRATTDTLTNKTLTAPKIANTGFIADANGNEQIIFNTTASAVNQFEISNAATGNGVTLASSGGDTNINIKLDPKGSGVIDVSSSKISNVSDPTSDQDAATKAYIDTALAALSSTTLTEGNSSVVVADSGTGSVTITVDGNEELTITDSGVTVAGNLTVNGTTTTVNSTNTTLDDNLLELNSGAASNANDSGIIIERGSTGDNAIFMWDESADKFTLGTTTATASSTGNITISTGTLVANLEGAVTGNASTATTATNVTATANNTTNETVYITFVDGATGAQGIETDTNLTYNPSTNVLTTTASAAKYADLAEIYKTDQTYDVGTVMVVGGVDEVTKSSHGQRAIGVISESPAYLMNSEAEGQPVALKGKVDVKVRGPVQKGDELIASDDGTAIKSDHTTQHRVFAIALGDNASEDVALVQAIVL